MHLIHVEMSEMTVLNMKLGGCMKIVLMMDHALEFLLTMKPTKDHSFY